MIAHALEVHELTTNPRAVVIRWSANPVASRDTAVQDAQNILLGGLVFWNLLVVPSVLVSWYRTGSV